jgi:hypothetical protein
MTKPNIQTAIFANRPVVHHSDGVSWSKQGGYAGAKTLGKIVERAIAANFTKADIQDISSPDGSHVGATQGYLGPLNEQLIITETYGVTKDANKFSATLYLKKG